ncbi:hypothetical protein [Bulleidia sp. zg-1006]|uniref:hypothetical protein n=1 Tax=Bulleidia sp. zg-1006 TaxID=2806552 RepID=UPI0019399BC2|nr:hypothetical protein [Bulleidia sp. zg-1006]QRG87245.1 hypothetical protein JOS54_02750 [Bulleidia sp. zg-1006]
MEKSIRFQDKLKNQMIKIAMISLVLLVLVFYCSAYIFNQHSSHQRLKNNNDKIEGFG